MQNSSANLQKYKELLARASELEKQAKELVEPRAQRPNCPNSPNDG